jgi:predicted ATPase
VLSELQAADRAVVVAVDDLHWSDDLSARALLFALRRMQADRVLGVLAACTGELGRLGDAWSRFAAGDHRVTRLRLGGLAQAGDELPAPRALAAVVLGRLGALSQPARGLVTAAAVLGYRSPLAVAAAMAGLPDPLAALDEAAAAGLVAEDLAAPVAGVAFVHPLVRIAVRDDLRPADRHRLHRAAAALLPAPAALAHRAAAALGPDDRLAGDLETAAVSALRAGSTARAAALLAQASTASTEPAGEERRLLDGLAALVNCGDVAAATDL